jgi:hypothetical protein
MEGIWRGGTSSGLSGRAGRPLMGSAAPPKRPGSRAGGGDECLHGLALMLPQVQPTPECGGAHLCRLPASLPCKLARLYASALPWLGGRESAALPAHTLPAIQAVAWRFGAVLLLLPPVGLWGLWRPTACAHQRPQLASLANRASWWPQQASGGGPVLSPPRLLQRRGIGACADDDAACTWPPRNERAGRQAGK